LLAFSSLCALSRNGYTPGSGLSRRAGDEKAAFEVHTVDEHLRLSDSQMTIDVYWARANAAMEYQFWADNYMNNIEYYKLDVETISPVHMNVMKQAEVIGMVKSGVKRARDRCAAELAKGSYFAGCPVQSKRY
jgi:hypothetical protein